MLILISSHASIKSFRLPNGTLQFVCIFGCIHYLYICVCVCIYERVRACVQRYCVFYVLLVCINALLNLFQAGRVRMTECDLKEEKARAHTNIFGETCYLVCLARLENILITSSCKTLMEIVSN